MNLKHKKVYIAVMLAIILLSLWGYLYNLAIWRGIFFDGFNFQGFGTRSFVYSIVYLASWLVLLYFGVKFRYRIIVKIYLIFWIISAIYTFLFFRLMNILPLEIHMYFNYVFFAPITGIMRLFNSFFDELIMGVLRTFHLSAFVSIIMLVVGIVFIGVASKFIVTSQ